VGVNKALTIGKIHKEIAGDKVVFSSQIDFGNQTQTLWYRLDAEYSDSFCDDRADGLVASLLFFSLMNGADIVSTLPISEKLYYQLTYHLIPQLCRCNKSVISPIKIKAPLVSTVYQEATGVGCGISCGVDSFTTLYEYTKLVPLDSYKLTHLTYFKVGAHDGQIGKYDKEVQEDLFQSQLSHAKAFCTRYGYKLIVVESNLTEIIDRMFGFYPYEQFHSYVGAGTVLQLQKLFNRYYYSSTYGLDEFYVNVKKDAAHYEGVLLPMLSTETTSFYSSNQDMSRIEKVRLISDFEQSYEWLLVCWLHKPNCGKCGKCIRTMLELDFVGKLELYRACFDVDEYFKRRDRYLRLIVQTREHDYFMQELYDYAIAHDIALPPYENENKDNYLLGRRNTLNRVFNSLRQRGVRETVSIALQHLIRREL
jgi:hypothetical protein